MHWRRLGAYTVLILAMEHGQSLMRWPPVIPWDRGKASPGHLLLFSHFPCTAYAPARRSPFQLGSTYSHALLQYSTFIKLQPLLVMLDFTCCVGVALSKPARAPAPPHGERRSRRCEAHTASPSLVPDWWCIETRKETMRNTPGSNRREQSCARGRLRPCRGDCSPMSCSHPTSW